MPRINTQLSERTGLIRNEQASFATRTPTDEHGLLSRRYSTFSAPDDAPSNEAANSSWIPTQLSQWFGLSRPNPSRAARDGPASVREDKFGTDEGATRRRRSSKLGTLNGVFVPVVLNVVSVLMFLRFGFIVGQSGVLGMAAMLVVSYLINTITTMSVSAIATNGTVRGGGAYYMISRSLGPEFGGSIGIVFYLGSVFSCGMSTVGLVDCFVQAFGNKHGRWSHWLPDDSGAKYLWATIVLLLCTAICLAGSAMFARCSNFLLVLVLVAIFSIPVSALFVQPFVDKKAGIEYTGLSMVTLINNLEPRFTRGAAGSINPGQEDFRSVFGVLFPATGGIFAGASMSGDLRAPSRSIPKGTLYGLLMTFLTYATVILSLGAIASRETFYRDVNIIQDVNLSGPLILVGELATSFFSALFGVIGSSRILQALARDDLVPGLGVFARSTRGTDEPLYAVLATYFIAQITIIFDLNRIASFVTMAFLMTFLVTNLACFLLKISSAPNFRPGFRYFNWQTAFAGTVASGAAMFFVDGVYAMSCIGLLVALFALIHYTSKPKAWGDVSQALIYHSVRKYLLRLRQEHVKFWRPQILLFVNDPRTSYKLIQFCNSLKKGALFILGHVIVAHDFAGAVPEARKQQQTWTNYIDFSKIKAFVNVAISPALEWGARNVVLTAGLGSMRPNIIIMGAYNLNEYRSSKADQKEVLTPLASPSMPRKLRRRRVHDEQMEGQLPTDGNRTELAVAPKGYVTVIEDMILRLKVNFALAVGFDELELPAKQDTTMTKLLSYAHTGRYHPEENSKRYIDLWPIQMSADITTEGEGEERNVHTTNFDTYTLILQLGCILATVPSWKRAYTLRVAVFVEYESDVEEERGRVEALLSNLRIEAEVMVFWLAAGDLASYKIIINGDNNADTEMAQKIERTLDDDEWWHEVKEMRRHAKSDADRQKSPLIASDAQSMLSVPSPHIERFDGFGKLLHRRSRRSSHSRLSRIGINPTMQTHRLDRDLVDRASATAGPDPSDDSDTSSDNGALIDESSEESDKSAASENDRERYTFPEQNVEAIPIKLRRNTISTASPASSMNLSESGSLRLTSVVAQRLAGSVSSDKLKSRRKYARKSQEQSLTSSEELPQKPEIKLVVEGETSSSQDTPTRPQTKRYRSYPRLSSTLIPRPKIVIEETNTGPSIMFSNPSPPERDTDRVSTSIYQRSPRRRRASSGASTRSNVAAAAAAQDLSFNNLPSRAQHLILNELMRAHSGNGDSGETAVVFTTLPPPLAGTSDDEEESVRYLTDLETLCQGLPPVLMVHSNSISVTMNL